jgi:hypothetical protein
MDLSKLVLAATLVYVLDEVVKRKFPKVWAAGDLFIALGMGIGVTFLVGATVWAHSEVFRGVALDNMNVASKLVAGLLLGAGAVGVDLLVGKNAAIRDIGTPLVRKPTADPHDQTGKRLSGTGLRGVRYGEVVTERQPEL